MKRMFAGGALIAIVTTVVAIAVAQTPPTAPNATKNPPAATTSSSGPTDKPPTSKLVLKETPYTFHDPVFGQPVAVFEAVGESSKPEDKKLYLSPICQVVPWDSAGKVRYKTHTDGGRTVLSLKLLNYHDDMFAQAAERILALHKVKFAPNQFALMLFSTAVFKFKTGGAEYVSTLGDWDQFLTLPKSATLQFELPEAATEAVKRAADSEGGLQVTGTLFFNAIGLKRRVEQLTFDDLQQTDLGKTVNAVGAGYYTVGQVESILTQAAMRRGYWNFEDPGMPQEVATQGKAVFDKAVQVTAEAVLKNLDDCRAADEACRRASGITASDFKPVELGFTYNSEVLNQTDYKEANKKAEEFYLREKTALSVSAKARWGPLSGGGKYSRETDKGEHKKYEDQKDFEEHKKNFRAENGTGVRFEPRGLNLVEKGALKRAMSATTTSVTVRPVNEAEKMAVVTNTAESGGEFATGLDEFLKYKARLGKVEAAVSAHSKRLDGAERGASDINRRLGGVEKTVGAIKATVGGVEDKASMMDVEKGSGLLRFRTPSGVYAVLNENGLHFFDKKGQGVGSIPVQK